MPQQYHFTTVWKIDAPLQEVWNAIYQIEEWPKWWKGMMRVTKTAMGRNDWDNQYYLTWKSALPYTLSFSLELTQLKMLSQLSGQATGELQGTGTWHFEAQDATHTLVTYNWDVATTKPWMNALSFLLKPVFRINHNLLMKKGETGLKAWLQH